MANGSGTQQDPYIFSSFSELLEMQSEATNSTYYEYGGTEAEEDLNDIYPEGLSDSLSLTGIIDFKNLVISNFRSFAQYAIRFSGSFKNLTLKNVIWATTVESPCFIYGITNDTFYNVKIYCTIDLSINSTGSYMIYDDSSNRSNHIDKCVIRLRGKVNNTSSGGLTIFKNGAMVKDCNIIFDDFICNNKLHIKENSGSTPIGYYMLGCYIGGKLTTDNVKDTYVSNVTVQTHLASTYNIFNIETEATFTHRGYGFNIFNSTKAPNFVSDTETNIIGVTDSQLKDALYLQSIGFPCYRGE
jgi:hypothetical protein